MQIPKYDTSSKVVKKKTSENSRKYKIGNAFWELPHLYTEAEANRIISYFDAIYCAGVYDTQDKIKSALGIVEYNRGMYE